MDKAYLKRVGIYIMTSLLAVAVIIYIVYHFFAMFATELLVQPAQNVVWEESVSSDGYIFRAETVLYTESAGAVSSLFDVGEHVSAGASVARVYDRISEQEQAEIAQIDKKLAILNDSNLTSEYAVANTKYIDSRINLLYYEIRSLTETSSPDSASLKRDELLTLLNRREIITNQRLNFNNEIAELRARREQILGSSSDTTVSTSVPGYYYPVTDGYEELFSADKIDELTVSSFKALTLASADEEQDAYPAGKIITDHFWYLGCTVDKTWLSSFRAGAEYKISFPYSANADITFTLYKVLSDVETEDCVLIFRTGVTDGSFSFSRSQRVEIFYDTIQGIWLPPTSVRVVGGERGVYILQDNEVLFVPVRIIFEKDGYYIAEGFTSADEVNDREVSRSFPLRVREDYMRTGTKRQLRQFDMIITQGKELYDGKIIDNYI